MTPREELIALRRLAELEAKEQSSILKQPQRMGAKRQPKVPYVPGALVSSGNASLAFSGVGGDELTGAMQSVLPEPYGPGGGGAITGIPDRYRMARDSARQQQAQWNQDYPVSSVVVPAATGVLGAAKAGPALAAQGAKQFPKAAAALANSPMKRYGAGILGSSAAGGAGGYAYGEDATDAAMGAAIGAGFALAVPPVAKLAGWVGNKIWQGGNKAWDLLRSGDKRVMRKIAQAMDDDNIPLESITQRMDELGPESMPIDLGPSMTSMGENYATIPGASQSAATKALTARARGSQQRIVKDLMEDSGSDLNIDGAVQRLHANMREIGKGYDDLYQTSVELNSNLQSLMKRPSVQDGIRNAGRIAADEGDSAFQGFMVLNPDTKELAWVKRPTLKAWDYVKRGLDDVIDNGTDATTGKLTPAARRALDIKRELVSEIDAVAPDYANIRRAYASEKSAESALLEGRKVLRAGHDAETTARKVAQMGDAEKEFYRIGVARALVDKVRAKQELFKPWNASPLERDKITAALGKTRADKFIKRLETESLFATTKNTVTANSATAKRLQGMNEMAMDPSAITDIASGNLPNLLTRSFAKDLQKVPPSMNRAAAGLLYNPNSLRDPRLQAQLRAPLNSGGNLFDATDAKFYSRLLGGASQAGGLLTR